MKTEAFMFCTFILLNEISSQSITTVTYTGTLTRIECPAQGSYRLPAWSGPPAGTPYTLESSADFNPSLPADKLARLSYADNQQDLQLSNTKMGDAGAYTCSILGQFSAATNWLNVRVLSAEPDITTSVSVDGNGVRATEGWSLTVTCTSRGGNPAPNVVWYKGSITGQELVRASTGTQVGDTYTVTLPYTFIPSRQDDRQQLVCRSYYPTPADAQGSQTKAVTLYLYLKPLQPTLSQSASVVTGGTVTATCTTTGSRPAADISWMYRGQTLTPAVVKTEDQSSHTFTVVSALQMPFTATDNGQPLQCSVINRAQTSPLTASRTLDVQFPVERSSTSITGNNQIESNGKNSLHLTCKTGSSNPASVIAWKKGSDSTSSTNGYTETPGANNGIVRSQILTLRPTRHDDGDTITCSVSNGVLQVTDTTSVVLNLQYSPVIANMADMGVTEGDQSILKCSANSKPVSSFTWKKGSATVAQGTGTATYNGYDYTISTVDRTQAGTYTCTADNQLSQTDSKHTTLTVLYPPDIDVIAVNTTFNSLSTTVTCYPSGVPDQYAYQRWVHTWNGQTVTHPVSLPNTRVLTLTDLSYAHSGVYTCGVSNGVKGVSQGSGSLLVTSFPVLVGDAAAKEVKTSGQLLKPITARFQYFSNAGKGFVKVYWTNGMTEEVGTVTYRDVDVQLPVFGSTITTPGTEAIINITVKEESRFGRYDVRVTNEVDTVTFALVIQPLGPPEPPRVVNVTVLDHQSANVTWISGFPNGLNQTFVIQYSTDNTTWRNISLYGGLSSEQPHSKVISGLDSSQSYYMRLLATNERGESTPTDIFDFVTEASFADQEKQSSTGVIAGGAAGGAVSALIVITVVIFVIWRRRKKESSSGEASNTVEDASSHSYETLRATRNTQTYDTLQQNNDQPHTYENYSTERTPYESLQPRERNETQTYDQLHVQETQPTVYENLKLTSII